MKLPSKLPRSGSAELAWIILGLAPGDPVSIFRKGRFISEPGDTGHVFVVNRGRVALYRINEAGRKFTHAILTEGEVFGDFGTGPLPFYARALEECALTVIDTARFTALFAQAPPGLLSLFRYYLTRLSCCERRTASIATDESVPRVVKLLLDLGRPTSLLSPNRWVTDPWTHQQLSEMLGLSRQRVTMVLSTLQQRGFLKRRRKAFAFDQDRLLSLLAPRYSALPGLLERLQRGRDRQP